LGFICYFCWISFVYYSEWVFFFLLFLWLGVVWLSYADLDGVPSQTAGVSSLLASDWNTYVRDNFDSIKFGHVVVADNTAKSAISAVEGIMVYQSDVDTLFLYNGSAWVPAVDTVSLVDSAVETAKINDLAVTTAKIDDLAVTTGKIDASAVTSAKIADNTIVLGDLATALQAFLVPTGTVSAFAGSAAPTGYLLCNGDVVPNGSGTVQSVTTDYAALYAVVGSSYGVAGALPDLRGRTIIGVGTGTEITGVLGTVQGVKEVTLSAAQSGTTAHDHPSGTTGAGGAHSHTYSGTTGGHSTDWNAYLIIISALGGSGAVSCCLRVRVLVVLMAGLVVDHQHGLVVLLPSLAHTHTYTITAATAAAAVSAHTNIQPSLPLNYIIKY
jgi:microcystin-dependent protein